MSACPTPETLAALIADRLPDGDRLATEAHAASCPECRAWLQRRAEEDSLFRTDGRGTASCPPEWQAIEDRLCAGTPAHVAAPPDAPRVPSLPGYVVLEEVGRGGMGVVYRARQSALGRDVALKLILAGAYSSQEQRSRFRLEAEAVARFNHPHIVQVYDFGEADGVPYQALEYVPGGTLAARVGGQPVAAAEAARLVQTLAHAVDYAHRHGVVHRDLKPGNVLMQGDEPKLVDFGLARVTDATQFTLSGAVLGTPGYLAPEQAGGRSGRAGRPADVYGLGAILYHLLTGRAPFVGPSPMDTLVQVLEGEPVPPRRLVASVPADLETVCLKCLRTDPSRRYASAADLAEDLRRFRAGEPVLARRVGRAERLARWARRNPAVASLTVAVTAAVAVALVGITLQYREADRQRRTAESKSVALRGEVLAREEALEQVEREKSLALDGLVTATLLRAGDLITERPEDALRLLLDPVAVPPDRRDHAWGFLHGNCLRRVQALGSHQDRVPAVAASGDGKLIATGERNSGTIRLYDAAGGRLVRTWRGPNGGVRSLAFSPDGKRLASCGGFDKAVTLWDPATGAAARTLAGHTEFVRRVAFSPDGLTLASSGEDRTVRLWDATNGKQRHLLATPETVAALAFAPGGRTLAGGIGQPGADVLLWDVEGGKPLPGLKAVAGRTHALAFSRDGRTLVVGGDEQLQWWDVASRSQRFRSRGKGFDTVWSLALSPDGGLLAAGTSATFSGGADRTANAVRLWDPETGAERSALYGHAGFVSALAWTPDGRTLVSGSEDGSVKRWSPRAEPSRATLAGHRGEVWSVAFRRGGRTLASGGYDATVRLWDVSGRPEQAPLRGRQGFVRPLAFSPDGDTLAAGVAGGGLSVVELWDVRGRRVRAQPDAHTGHPFCELVSLAYSPDGAWLASGCRNFVTFNKHAEHVCALAFSPDGATLAVPSPELHVRLWDAAGKERPPRAAGREDFLAAAADGKGRPAAPPDDRTVRLWDVETASVRAKLTGHTGFVRAVAFRGDGKVLASAGDDRTVRLWDLPAGRPRAVLEAHAAPVLAVAFSPDGKTLASADAAGVLRLWHVETAQLRATMTGHADYVPGLAFAPDGKTLASASADRTVRLWDVGSGR